MKLLIATPFYEMKGWSGYISSLVYTTKLLERAGIDFDFWELSGDSYIDRARNKIALDFMESDYTDLLFIDSDERWNLKGLVNLLKADADVVGAGYPCKNNWKFFSCLIDTLPDGRPETNAQGLISARTVPTGFMKIRRTVFEQLANITNTYMDYEPSLGKERKFYNFFGRIPPLGEDGSFCLRWQQIGGKVWVEPRVTITHYGVKGWEGNYHEFLLQCPGGSHYGMSDGISKLAGKHQDEACWVVGKGASLKNLTPDDVGAGPVIAINHAIEAVENLGLPNPLYSMQKDNYCSTPKAASLLVHKPESDALGVLKDYRPRYVFDNEEDFGINRFFPSVVSSIYLAKLMGCSSIKFLCCDSFTNGDCRTFPDLNKDHTYLMQRPLVDVALHETQLPAEWKPEVVNA